MFSVHNALTERYDVLIIGAGSSGTVLANRLSEDGNQRVALLEAGPLNPLNQIAAEKVRNANQPAVSPTLNWEILATIKKEAETRGPQRQSGMFNYEGGKLVGGSSAVNAALALRGTPGDYDEWVNDCGEDWGWEQVLPYFRCLENDPDGSDYLHGRRGPLPIRRERREELTSLQRGLLTACMDQGYSWTEDHNDPHTTGVGIFPKNAVDGVRISTKMAYLDPVASRPNLTIISDAHVNRIVWRNHNLCDGVEVFIEGKKTRLYADKVLVCAGALNTPAILMRSGIGNPDYLTPLGITVKSPLIGVGEGLMDHPVVGIWGIPKSGMINLGEPARQVLLRFTSGQSGYENDMHICTMAGVDVSVLNPNLASALGTPTVSGLLTSFNKSTSRGHVRITSADPFAKLDVFMNCLGEKSDIPPLKHGVRLAWELMQQPSIRSHFERVLAWTEGMIRSEVALEQAIKSFVRPAAHLSSSARMGKSPDRGAVVDPQGRVFGVENVWVADASIIPILPSATPHLTVLMVAEKIAAQLQPIYL